MSFGYGGYPYAAADGCGYGYRRPGNMFTLIVVLFILLVIVGAACFC